MNTNNNLIKFLYNANLSLIFLYLKQQDIGKDYILSLLDYIKNDKENQEILYKSFVAGLNFISNSSFYYEILDKLFLLIDEIFKNDQNFDKKLEYFIFLNKKEIPINQIKHLVSNFILLDEEKASKYIEKIIFIINSIRDKRIRNPLIKRILNYSKDKTELFNINLNVNLYFLLKDEKYFNVLLEYFKQNPDKEFQKIEILLNAIKNYNDKELIEKILDLVLSKIIVLSDDQIMYNVLLNILDILSVKTFLTNQKLITDKVYVISSNLKNKIYSLKLSIYIVIILINNSSFNQGIILLSRLFSLLNKLEDKSILEILDYLFLSLNKINYVYRKNFINHLISHIFNFSERISNKDLIPIILDNFLMLLSKFNLIDEMTIIFNKSIEIASKVDKKNKSNYIIDNILKYLHLIGTKEIINILNKSIYTSEKLKNDKRLMSLLSISYIKRDLLKEILYYVKKELENSIDQEYKGLVVKHFVKILLKINDLQLLEQNIKEILNIEIENDFIRADTYLYIAENIVKLNDKNIILLVFNILVNKIFVIKLDFIKYDYILKIFSFISNFAKDKEFEEILYELTKIVVSFENKNLRVNMYKSFMISLLKLGNKFINKLNKEIEKDIENFDYDDYKSEILSVVGTSYYRTGSLSKANKYFSQSLDFLEQIKDDNIFFDTISNLLIRSISANLLEDFNFIINKIKSLFDILETEEKKFSFLSKIVLKIKQLNVINEKYKKEIVEIIENNMNFSNENFKIFLYNNLIYTFHNINDSENKDIYINKFIDLFNKLNINPNNVFSLIQISLVLIKGIDKKTALTIINKIVDIPNLKNYNDAIIFLFKEVSFLGSLYVEKSLIEKIISIIKQINLNSLNDRQLYNLAISFIQISEFEEFINAYNYIKDINIKSKLQYETINILFTREDINNLINYIPYILDNSNNLDLILSYIILLNKNKKEIDNIKIF